jgi:hypothetical protein
VRRALFASGSPLQSDESKGEAIEHEVSFTLPVFNDRK